MYILDTDHISVMESAGTSAEGQRLRFRMGRLKPEGRITTIITFEEQIRGWMSFLAQARSLEKQVGAYRRLKGVLHRYLKITVLEFDEAAAVEFERLATYAPSRWHNGFEDRRNCARSQCNSAYEKHQRLRPRARLARRRLATVSAYSGVLRILSRLRPQDVSMWSAFEPTQRTHYSRKVCTNAKTHAA